MSEQVPDNPQQHPEEAVDALEDKVSKESSLDRDDVEDAQQADEEAGQDPEVVDEDLPGPDTGGQEPSG